MPRKEIESVPLSGITVDTLDHLPVIVQRVRKRFGILMRIPETEEEAEEAAALLRKLARSQDAKDKG